MPPATAVATDKKRTGETFSRNSRMEARATKIGLVVTKMTELATEVYFNEVIHSAKPDFMKILPPLDFTEDTTPSGEHVIRIKNLGPSEHFFTQMLSYKTPVPALLNVRSKAGQAKPVPVQFQRVYPKWFYWLVGFVLVVVIFVVSYWIYRGAEHLVKIIGIA